MPVTAEHAPRAASDALFPEPLLRFARLFNRAEFWESHEVLEGPWRKNRSGFYHGLILYASAFVHTQRNNPRGISAQLRKAEKALQPYEPAYLGVDVARIQREAGEIRRRVRERGETPERWETLIVYPRIELSADRVRGDEAEHSV